MSERNPIEFDTLARIPEIIFSQSTMLWNKTGSWRYMRPRYRQLTPPCNAGCPAGNDVEGFIRLAQAGDLNAALALIKAENPFPGVCGRVCYHPCEDICNRGSYDNAIAINAIERYISEKAEAQFTSGQLFAHSGFRVAVVGSGPAGLTCAYHLARMGHSVTVFEAEEKPGGILRYGIPDYRLPRDVLDREIEAILSLNIHLVCNKRVGRDLAFDELDDFHAIFLATGCHKERNLFPDEKTEGFYRSLKFLASVAKREIETAGQTTAVIGGGNSAIDAARTALRLGSEVTLFYHRSENEMPAYSEEVMEAKKEGVNFRFLVQPLELVKKNGRVAGVKLRKTKLGAIDESGRRKPEPVMGSDFIHKSDCVVAAIGEMCDLEILPGAINHDGRKVAVDEFGATSGKKFFAGGDAALSDQTVASAIGSGKASAIAIDAYLNGTDIKKIKDTITVADTSVVSVEKYLAFRQGGKNMKSSGPTVDFEDINTAYFKKQARSKREKIGIPSRLQGFEEVCKTLSDPAFKKEVERCFHCGVCTGCDNCVKFCPDASVIKRADGSGYDVDLDYCKGCGICVNECPRSCIFMEEDI